MSGEVMTEVLPFQCAADVEGDNLRDEHSISIAAAEQFNPCCYT
jgi:hypothetical protein